MTSLLKTRDESCLWIRKVVYRLYNATSLIELFRPIFKGFVAVGLQAGADWVSKLARASVKLSDDRFFHFPLSDHRALSKYPNGQSAPVWRRPRIHTNCVTSGFSRKRS